MIPQLLPFQNYWRTKDGHKRLISWKNSILRKPDDSVANILCTGLDITEQHEAETALRASEAKYRDLVQIERQLQNAQKMEALGTLAGGIAHDLNNILAPIIGYAELALCDSEPESILADNLKNVIQAGKRARDLVKQILTFSKQHDQEIRPIQLGAVVQEALRLFRASCPATISIRSSLHLQEQVLGDPTQLLQVIMNLCTNSLQAMAETGGTLEVALRRTQISSQARAVVPDLNPGDYLD